LSQRNARADPAATASRARHAGAKSARRAFSQRGWWSRFTRRLATNDHIRLLAHYDLSQLVYAFAIILAAPAIYVGVLMVRSDVEAHRRIAVSHQNGLLGGMLIVFGTILILLVGMATLGPWREPSPRAFPVHIVDLQAPISEAERNALKHSNP
jgi:hypothetical protein